MRSSGVNTSTSKERNRVDENGNYKGPYPIDQLNLVRDCLKNEFVNAPCRCRAEFHLKLKLGIVNTEIIDYFRNGKSPEGLTDDFDLNSGSEIDELYILDDDEEKAQESSKISAQPTTSFEAQLSSSHQKASEVIIDRDKAQIAFFISSFGLKHGCDAKFCPQKLTIREKLESLDLLNVVFVCDFCFKMLGTKTRMEEHLKAENHYSASEYILEPKEIDLNEPVNISPNESLSETSLTKSTDAFSSRKIAFMKKRSSLQNHQATDEHAVFCPKPDCRLFMSTNILAGALHFKYAHVPNTDIEIFSLGKLKCTREVEMEKKHNCPECKQYHKQLVSLVDHLKRTKHFPSAAENEINVYVCPFDDCYFKTVVFFSFKTHLLGHRFFTAPLPQGSGSEKVICKILVYTAPDSFYHVTRFGVNSDGNDKIEWERECERKAIADLLELHKNQQFSELNKVLKARKEELGPSNLNRCTQFL